MTTNGRPYVLHDLCPKCEEPITIIEEATRTRYWHDLDSGRCRLTMTMVKKLLKDHKQARE